MYLKLKCQSQNGRSLNDDSFFERSVGLTVNEIVVIDSFH